MTKARFAYCVLRQVTEVVLARCLTQHAIRNAVLSPWVNSPNPPAVAHASLVNPPTLTAPQPGPFLFNPLPGNVLRDIPPSGTPTAFWFDGDVSLGYE